MTHHSEPTEPHIVVILFKTTPEHQQNLIDTIAEEMTDWVRQLPGFRSAMFLTSADGTRVVNYAQWRSKEAWEEFINDPRNDRIRRRVNDAKGVEFEEVDMNHYSVSREFVPLSDSASI